MDDKTAKAIVSMTPAQQKLVSDKATAYIRQLQAIKTDMVRNPVLKEYLLLKAGVPVSGRAPSAEDSISKIFKRLK